MTVCGKGKRLNVVIFTTHASFIHIYEYIKDSCTVLAAVVPTNRKGSGKIREVEALCRERGITVLTQPFKSAAGPFNQRLRKAGANLGISWSYSQIIQPDTLAVFEHGIWNMHGGKIPEYRGANVLQWAIANGEKQLGVTWHLMEEEVDAGAVLGEGLVDILEDETALEVREKLFSKGISLFKALWQNYLTDGIAPRCPKLDGWKSYRPRTAADGLVTAQMSAEQIRNLLRAQCPPWPAPLLRCGDKVYCVHGIRDIYTPNFRGTDVTALEYSAIDRPLALFVSPCTDGDVLKSIANRE